MASDYGDEAGEKLFDWMLRMGQDASQDAIRASAERLKSAIRNLRGQIDGPLAEAERGGVREYARLNLSEFEELPDYASLREIIETRLDAAAIEHGMTISYSRWKMRQRWTRLSRSSNVKPTRHATAR